ncbi:nose resistant to fluoxetine protein 6-like [Chrysoperla carnea]|uniref:nose resistant to fluoxetine protein 6-like n=1 Tax=Chrysoperla carnea TaxID=189513 RepID=UPI001D07F2CC|nr:nose resistant to fluoxetine protein 6-like [Chrysoperla carnea]
MLKLFCVLYLIFAIQGIANSTRNRSSINTQFKRLFSQFTQPDRFFLLEFSKNISETCRQDTKTYLTDLNDLKLWAVKMFDATGKFSSGFLNGNVHVSGDIDLCHSIVHRRPTSNGAIKGKFCQANIFAEISSTNHYEISQIMNLVHSHRAIVSTYEDDIQFFPTFSKMSWTFCIPSSCTHNDLEIFLNELIKPYNHTSGLEVKIKVDSDGCVVYSKTLDLFTLQSYVILGIIFIALTLCILGGVYDYMYNYEACNIKEQSLPIQILYAFSLRRNWQLLTKLSDSEEDDITCVHGIRSIFSLSIYLLHRSIFGLFKPFTNRTDLVQMMEGAPSMVFRAFWNHVDTFVILSGLLTAYYATKKLQEGGRLNIKSMYIKRYLKFAPIFLIVVSTIHFMTILRSGGSTMRVVKHFVRSCETGFWKSLLFISNIDGINDMCYPPAHQLLTDFQLYLVSPFIILYLWKHSQHATRILTGIILALSIFKAVTMYFNGLGSVIYFGISLKEMKAAADSMYLNPVHRATPYLCGLGLGYSMRTWKKTYLSYDHRNIGWCIALICGYYSFFAMAESSLRGYHYNRVQETAYGVAQPLMWSFTICWIIYMCHSGYGGILNTFLSMKIFQLFSRIAYPFYISQIVVIFFGIGGVNAPIYVRSNDIIDLNEIVTIIGVSVALTLLFMYPVGHVYSVLSDLRIRKHNKIATNIKVNGISLVPKEKNC